MEGTYSVLHLLTIVGYFRFLSEKSENKFLSFPQRGFCGAHRAVAWIFYEFSTHSADHTNASKIVILTMLEAANFDFAKIKMLNPALR